MTRTSDHAERIASLEDQLRWALKNEEQYKKSTEEYFQLWRSVQGALRDAEDFTRSLADQYEKLQTKYLELRKALEAIAAFGEASSGDKKAAMAKTALSKSEGEE